MTVKPLRAVTIAREKCQSIKQTVRDIQTAVVTGRTRPFLFFFPLRLDFIRYRNLRLHFFF